MPNKEWITEKRKIIVDTARDLIGTPFLHLGRSKKGVDCIGVGVLAYQAAGLLPPPAEMKDDGRYNKTPTDLELLARLKLYMVEIPYDKVKPGDIVYVSDVRWVHIGVISGRNTLIHAYAKNYNKVGEHTIDVTWRNRIQKCFTWPEFLEVTDE